MNYNGLKLNCWKLFSFLFYIRFILPRCVIFSDFLSFREAVLLFPLLYSQRRNDFQNISKKIILLTDNRRSHSQMKLKFPALSSWNTKRS